MSDVNDDDLTLRSIRGIGAVFAERLTTVGIATVDDLASANASSLAYTMEVRYGTVADWINRRSVRHRIAGRRSTWEIATERGSRTRTRAGTPRRTASRTWAAV